MWYIAASVIFFFFKTESFCPFYDGWFRSAPAHTALSVQQFLTKNGMTPVPYPAYSSSLAPAAFFWFPHMKKVLKGKCFVHAEEVKQKQAEALKGIKIDEFKNCFEQWKKVSLGLLHQLESTFKVNEV